MNTKSEFYLIGKQVEKQYTYNQTINLSNGLFECDNRSAENICWEVVSLRVFQNGALLKTIDSYFIYKGEDFNQLKEPVCISPKEVSNIFIGFPFIEINHSDIQNITVELIVKLNKGEKLSAVSNVKIILRK